MKITQDVRDYAAQQGISEAEAVERGMQEKSEEFRSQGLEIYQPR
jgi:phosphomethylpyrimidine synthase